MRKSRMNYGVYALMNGRAHYKTFTSNEAAQSYISKSLLANDYQVTDIITNEGRVEYYCCDHTRFIVTDLNN